MSKAMLEKHVRDPRIWVVRVDAGFHSAQVAQDWVSTTPLLPEARFFSRESDAHRICAGYTASGADAEVVALVPKSSLEPEQSEK